jgi:Protein of unknown function (DUF4232)
MVFKVSGSAVRITGGACRCALLAVLTIIGLGAAIANGALAAARPPAAAGSLAATTAGAPRPCPAGALTATVTLGSAYAGGIGYYVTVTNHSKAAACTLNAPLSVRLLGLHGKSLPTHPRWFPPGPYTTTLKPGQWVQAAVTFPAHRIGGECPFACEPVAYSLAISIGGRRVIAPMDPVRVCGGGAQSFRKLAAVPLVPGCAASALVASFHGSSAAGVAANTLRLANRGASSCWTSTIISLTLLGQRRQKLPTKVSHGVASPYVIGGHAEALLGALFATTPGPGEPTTGPCEPAGVHRADRLELRRQAARPDQAAIHRLPSRRGNAPAHDPFVDRSR